jgi:ADP-ribose pyrophosphatase
LPTKKKTLHTCIKHPGAAVILPLNSAGEILLLRQYRPSIAGWLYELPAGTIEQNESPIICAKRELEEETGYSADKFVELGQLVPMAGFCDEVQYLYIAKDLNKTERLHCDDDEVIEIHFFALEEIEQMIIEGCIVDAKTIATLSKAKLTGQLAHIDKES